ncbi:MAG: ribonuclease III [Proteobacteria bacterium]|nr:ribonuclease III [Pseudomonadota bacterium]
MNSEDAARRAAEVLGHDFARPALLAEALTHPSARGGGGYERLEFLGDRVLGLIVADMLMAAFPAEPEGALSKRLAALVRREALARVGESLAVGDLLAMSRGEDEAGGRSNPAILADAVEALIGALYLDGGMAAAGAFVRGHWTAMMEADGTPPQDSKTRLQEWAQGGSLPLPSYATVAAEGPPHSPTFEVEVSVEGHAPERGRGPSKRAAEQAAAKKLLAGIARRDGGAA